MLHIPSLKIYNSYNYIISSASSTLNIGFKTSYYHTKVFDNKLSKLYTDKASDINSICADKVKAYGHCIASNIENLNKGHCNKEFFDLFDCLKISQKQTKKG